MTNDEAETIARERLAHLASSVEPDGNQDWNLLAEAAQRALAGDRTATLVFRKVFDEPGFAASASGMEVGYAALGIGLLRDTESIARLPKITMPFNGIGHDLRVARLLLGMR